MHALQHDGQNHAEVAAADVRPQRAVRLGGEHQPVQDVQQFVAGLLDFRVRAQNFPGPLGQHGEPDHRAQVGRAQQEIGQRAPRITVASADRPGFFEDPLEHVLADGADQRVAVREAPVERAGPDTGGAGDLLHRNLGAPLGEDGSCRRDDSVAIAAGIGPQPWRGVGRHGPRLS